MDKQLWETVYIAPPHEERKEGSYEGASKILMLLRLVSGTLVCSGSSSLLMPEALPTTAWEQLTYAHVCECIL